MSDNTSSLDAGATGQSDTLTATDGACISMIKRSGERAPVARMVTSPHAFEYKMTHKHRGRALIFSHEHFKKSELEPRPETIVDCQNLERVLKKFDFNVKTYKDFSYKKVKLQISEAVAQNHKHSDCILVALLTHGNSTHVYAWDKEYKLETIWQAFTADKCPSLAGKPKIFIVQADRGTGSDPGITMVPSVSGRIETDSDSLSNYKIPCFADFLFAFCTVPEHSSWSNSVQGSWFIQSLCAELEASGSHMDILTLLTFVAQRVTCFESYDEQQKQIPCTMSTLIRILKFSDRKDGSWS